MCTLCEHSAHHFCFFCPLAFYPSDSWSVKNFFIGEKPSEKCGLEERTLGFGFNFGFYLVGEDSISISASSTEMSLWCSPQLPDGYLADEGVSSPTMSRTVPNGQKLSIRNCPTVLKILIRPENRRRKTSVIGTAVVCCAIIGSAVVCSAMVVCPSSVRFLWFDNLINFILQVEH